MRHPSAARVDPGTDLVSRDVAKLRTTYAQLTSVCSDLRAASEALRDTAATIKTANQDLRARNAELRESARSDLPPRAGPAPLARVRDPGSRSS